jgi:hypothetical protein
MPAMDGEVPHTERLELRWTLERDEYLEAMRSDLYGRLRRPRSIAVVAGVGLLVFAGVTFGLGVTPTAVFVALVVVAICALTVLRYPRAAARRSWRNNPAMHGPQEAELGPAEVVFRAEHSQGTARWSAFDRVADSGRTYRLYLARRSRPAMYYIIPKRAMPGPNGTAELGELLRRYVAAGSQGSG